MKQYIQLEYWNQLQGITQLGMQRDNLNRFVLQKGNAVMMLEVLRGLHEPNRFDSHGTMHGSLSSH